MAMESRLPLTNGTDSHASPSECLNCPLPGRAAFDQDRRLAPGQSLAVRTAIEHEVQDLRVTPAAEAGIADHVWDLAELVPDNISVLHHHKKRRVAAYSQASQVSFSTESGGTNT